LFSAALVKIALAFWVVPRWGIVGESALLSAYLIISTALLVFIGLRKARQGEKADLKGE